MVHVIPPRRSPRRVLVAVTVAVTVAGSLALAGTAWLGTALADPPRPADPSAPGSEPVSALHYTLGDDVFQVPGFGGGGADPDGRLADLELTGVVHYPRRLAGAPRP